MQPSPSNAPPTDSVQRPDSASMAGAVSVVFADRPNLESVVLKTLAVTIDEKYPGLALNLSRTQLAMPAADGSYTFERLTTKALDYLATGAPIDFSDVGSHAFFLTENVPHPVKTPAGETPDIKQIEKLIHELAWSLPIGLQDAMTDYWNPISEQPSRWSLLSDALTQALQISTLRQPGLTDFERESVQQIIDLPDNGQRVTKYVEQRTRVYELETYLSSSTGNAVLFSPELLLRRTVGTHTTVLLCHPGGKIEPFASMDAFNQHWSARINDHYLVDSIRCKRYEFQNHVFGHQAELILNQQLNNVQAVRLPCNLGQTTAQALYHELSNPASCFTSTTQVNSQYQRFLNPQLPQWLHGASEAQKKDYCRYSFGVSSSKLLNKGRTFLSDILDLQAFTVDALTRALSAEQQRAQPGAEQAPSPDAYAPDKVLLTFTHNAATSGTTQSVAGTPMSLTELAITNLKECPRAPFTLTHRDGLALPDWLTADYITRTDGLIKTINIGKTYPEYLKSRLLSPAPEVTERKRLFAEQLRYQLPLVALELHLKNEGGISALGVRYVATLLLEDQGERFVDNQSIVMRKLALLRQAGAAPDVVNAMFIIEAWDVTKGPHVLYRPLYAESLREFATREALLEAIAQPTDLQQSVLAWLPIEARAIYDKGGFQTPHIPPGGLDDEPVPDDPPTPAQLAVPAGNERLPYLYYGQLLPYFYDCNVKALVDEADGNSAPQPSHRWTALLETGGTLFNALVLPQRRDPVLLTPWLCELANQLRPYLPNLDSQDPVARETATAEMIVNLAILLVERSPNGTPHAPLETTLKNRVMRPLAPRLAPEHWPRSQGAPLTEHSEGYYLGPNKKLNSALEFLYTHVKNKLSRYAWWNVMRLNADRPDTLPEPIRYGPRRGLYVIEGVWHAFIDPFLYRVNLLEGERVMIVDDRDTTRPGPHLKRDGQNQWSPDLRLRLSGGTVLTRITTERRRSTRQNTSLSNNSEST